jgi:AraC-like DNA-binding protein
MKVKMILKELPKIRSMSDMIFDPMWAVKDHSTNICELIHVRKGRLCQIAAGQKFSADAGDCLITPRQTMHRDVFDFQAGLEVFIVFFDWPLEQEFLKSVNNSNINMVSENTRAAMARVFDELRTDLGGGETDRIVASSRLFTILMLLYRDIAHQQNPSAVPDFSGNKRQWLVNEAKKYLEKHYHQPVTLEDIAASLKVSPFYLSRIFSHESDFSLFEYLNDVRMRKARELLREGRHIVADVAYMTGFEDSNYFSKVYKRYYGHSPSHGRFKRS